jgi:hypothetical protein
MSNLQNFKHRSHTNLLTGVGQKVKHLVTLGMELKGLYDAGRTVYALGSAAAPYVQAALPLLGAL